MCCKHTNKKRSHRNTFEVESHVRLFPWSETWGIFLSAHISTHSHVALAPSTQPQLHPTDVASPPKSSSSHLLAPGRCPEGGPAEHFQLLLLSQPEWGRLLRPIAAIRICTNEMSNSDKTVHSSGLRISLRPWEAGCGPLSDDFS